MSAREFAPHSRIWLEPEPPADDEAGRMWCHDNVWGRDEPADEYLLAANVQPAIEALAEALPVLEAARRMLAPMAKENNYGGDGGPLLDKIKAALAKAGAP